jgi:hypothetical protein
MKPETKLDRQVKALIEFVRTLKRRPERFCWRKSYTESALHRLWRAYSYVLWRSRLWLKAGLGELPPCPTLRQLERRASAARRAWKEEHHRELEEFRRSRVAWAEGLTIPRDGDEDE